MTKSAATAALIWSAVLGISAIFGSYAFACVFPFAAIATIAAATLDTRRGLALVGATWFANQVVGFSLMHYPQTFATVALGVSLGLGALAAWIVARLSFGTAYSLSPADLAAREGTPNTVSPMRVVAALAMAFVAYQVVIFAGALAFGGAGNFTPAIVGGVALNEALWFGGLSTLYLALGRALPARLSPRIA